MHQRGLGPRLPSGYCPWQASHRHPLCVCQYWVGVSVCMYMCVCVCVFCQWSSLLAADGRVSTEWVVRFGLTAVGRRWCGWQEWTMEGWRVSEEWGQAPEVQSHQLRQLCGANTGARRWWWGGWGWVCKGERGSKTRDVVTALLLLTLDN